MVLAWTRPSAAIVETRAGRPWVGSSSTRSFRIGSASDVNMKRTELRKLVDECYRILGPEETAVWSTASRALVSSTRPAAA